MKAKIEESQEINNTQDFVNNIIYNKTNHSWIIIHQTNFIDILIDVSSQSFCDQLRNKSYQHIDFQTNIYDALFVTNDKVIVSNKNMPVRIFNLQNQQNLEWWSIIDKKLNSEKYLTPIRMARYQDTIVGGGLKFMSIYDLNKMTVKYRVQQMNKRQISSLQLMNNNTVIAGQFNGQLTMLDLRSKNDNYSLKTHIDQITHIKLIQYQPYQFITRARKDNYIYLWDNRMLETFVSYYEFPLYGNQRTGFDIHQNGQTIFIGGQKGQIQARSIKNNEILFEYSDIDKSCISSICYSDENLIFSIGERQFLLDDQQIHNGHIRRLALGNNSRQFVSNNKQNDRI